MIKSLKTYICCILVVAVYAAPSSGQSEFSVDKRDGRFRLLLDGRLIVADAFSLAGTGFFDYKLNLTPELTAENGNAFEMSTDGWEGWIAGGTTTTGMPWSREVVVNSGRAEVTFAGIVPPRDHGADISYGCHCILVPCDVLKGANYTARVGRRLHLKPIKSGTFTGQESEGKYFLKGVRHIQFRGGAVDFSMDFSPSGIWSIYSSVDRATHTYVHVCRRGDYYVFAAVTVEARFGTKVSSKVVLRTGLNDLEKIHPIPAIDYRVPFPSLRRVQFTPNKPADGFVRVKSIPGLDRNFKACQLQPYDENRETGWITPLDAKVIGADEKNPLGPLFGGGISGKGKATFRIDHPNGKVLANILLSGAQGPVEVSLTANDMIRETVKVAEGSRKTVILPAAIRDGHLDITLDGSTWMISGIVVQLFLSEEEDFIFDRPWWVFGREPWKWEAFKNKELWKTWPDGAFERVNWADVVK